MKRSGQALIEFVLLLPVLIFFLFAIVDFGQIIYTKNHLESRASDMVSLIEEKKTYDEMVTELNRDNPYQVKLVLDYASDGYLTISLNESISILTPGLNLILGNPYHVEVKRVVPYE